MSAACAHGLTFRDPAGTLYFDKGGVFRRVRPAFREATEAFLASACARRWMDDRRMVGTAIASRDTDGSLLLTHERLAFPSYPWEWTAGQWVAAGELTLDLCEEALAEGLILKDATPLNILFRNAEPVFVDVLSFEPLERGNPFWLAYAQFARSFLLPLAASRTLGWRLAATLQHRDGYEPDDLYPRLSVIRRWFGPLRSLVTLPHLFDGTNAIAASRSHHQPPEIALAVLRRTLHGLRRKLHALAPAPRRSRWSEYASTCSHYSAGDHACKAAFVERSLAATTPRTVLDVGANTGVYSRIAAASGASVVALDTDLEAADANWREARSQRLPILVLVADMARPTPAVGWQNQESLSLLERAEGFFDTVLLLGVMHHLLLVDQIPLQTIFKLLHGMGARSLVIEWVPASDPQFHQLCRGREHLYGHLDTSALLNAAREHFDSRMTENLSNGRSLWLFERR